MLGFIGDCIRLFRVHHMGAIAIIPVLGAISQGCSDLTKLFILFIIGMFLNIFLFVSNDVVDAKLDRMSKLSRDFHVRAISKGTISKKTGVYLSIISVIIAYILSFLFFYRENFSFYLGILALSAGISLCTLYNLFGKRFLSSAFLASFATGLGVFYGAYMTTNNNVFNVYTWLLFVLVFNFMLFLTAVIGGFKDAGNDCKLDGKTIAIFLGVKIDEGKKTVIIPASFKVFTILLEISSIFILFLPVLLMHEHYEFWKLIFILILSIVSLIFIFKFLKIKSYNNQKVYKILIPLMAVNSMFLALILFPIIPGHYVLFLTLFPGIWFVINLPMLLLTKKYLPKPKLELGEKNI
jgi:4-hydroxybenzoate polyprenyltransferase